MEIAIKTILKIIFIVFFLYKMERLKDKIEVKGKLKNKAKIGLILFTWEIGVGTIVLYLIDRFITI